MSKEKVYTNEDLTIMQSWNLHKKIQVTQTRYIEWYKAYEGKVYVSFSGGKDSTVLADVIARVCKQFSHKLILVFVNTGLEYPEIRKFTETFTQWLIDTYGIEVELISLVPQKYDRHTRTYKRTTFKEVIQKYGYPVISKKVANSISRFRINPTEEWRYNKFINGINKDGTKTQFSIPKKWQPLALNNDIPISDICCSIMKHKPCIKYEKDTGNKPLIAMMADDDNKRKQSYIETGCNAFELERPMSNPMGFWLNKDVLTYLRDFNIPYCSVYGDIIEIDGELTTSGVKRTGCMFCLFGIHLEPEPNRLQQMKLSHPNHYKFCINETYISNKTIGHIENGELILEKTDEMIEREGLGAGKVLDFIGVNYK